MKLAVPSKPKQRRAPSAERSLSAPKGVNRRADLHRKTFRSLCATAELRCLTNRLAHANDPLHLVLRTYKVARIGYGGTRATTTCLVRNLSESGACLSVDASQCIPDLFNLVFDSGERSRMSRVIWRRAKRIGVAEKDRYVTCCLVLDCSHEFLSRRLWITGRTALAGIPCTAQDRLRSIGGQNGRLGASYG